MAVARTSSLLEEIKNLDSFRPVRGRLQYMTKEQRQEYHEMIEAVAAMTTRPSAKILASIIKQKFDIDISPRTINEHVHEVRRKGQAHVGQHS